MGRTAWVFPGQGAQAVGMGSSLVAISAAARQVFEQADAVLGFKLSALCFSGPEAMLTDTVNAQPAILVTSLAALRALQDSQPDLPAPDFVAGHSMGEYSALVAAGSLDFPAGLRLVRRRGELMKQAGEAAPGGMAAIMNLSSEALTEVCRQATSETGSPVQIANDNAPGQIVISGIRQAVARAGELAKSAGARRVMPLAVSIAAHSALMQPASEALQAAIEEADIHPPAMPLVGNVAAQPLETVEQVRAELVAQLTSAVRWVESIRWLGSQGVDTFVEIGPGTVLCGLIRRILPDAMCKNVSDADSIEKFKR